MGVRHPICLYVSVLSEVHVFELTGSIYVNRRTVMHGTDRAAWFSFPSCMFGCSTCVPFSWAADVCDQEQVGSILYSGTVCDGLVQLSTVQIPLCLLRGKVCCYTLSCCVLHMN